MLSPSLYCSNFNLVIRASDGSVWALGMGEHDRNANPLPLRVQSDFHFPRGTSATSACTTEGASGAKEGAGRVYAEVDPADGKHYLVLPLSQSSEGNGMLLRGHHRVTVVTEEAPVDVPAAQRALQERQVSAAADEILRGPTTVNRAHFPQQGLFEVVVHEGEAYLIELVLPMGSERNKEQPQYRLLNYSSGWRHNLMVVDTLK